MSKTKFRAWDKRHNKWIHPSLMVITNDGFYPDHREYEDGLSLFDYEYDLMQYTGVKDEDGNEICGGDVVELYLNDYGEMEKPEKFIVNCDKEFFPDVCYLQQIEAHINKSDTKDYIKIIGNIHENPELLGGAK